MYDVVVIGQGLSGLLSAIWARKQHTSVALVSTGAGKILQSAGIMDMTPGAKEQLEQFRYGYGLETDTTQNKEAIHQFQHLMSQLNNPYDGNLGEKVQLVTASGRIKETCLYPRTIKPVPKEGKIVVVGFKELLDFQATYIKENLQKELPQLQIDCVTLSVKYHSLRTLTQVDIARLLEDEEVRTDIIKQLSPYREGTTLFLFPSCLGLDCWHTVLNDLEQSLHTAVGEVIGMPPNATAVRLYNGLKKEAIRLGVRFFHNTTVVDGTIYNEQLQSITVHNHIRTSTLVGKQYIIATGGVLGGGLEITEKGYRDPLLHLQVDQQGKLINVPDNVYLAGASQGMHRTIYGITGGIFSILSSYHAVNKIKIEERSEVYA